MDRRPHLSPDRLAELADGDPTPDEAAHLAQCAACAAERAAHARVLTVAHLERERLLPPLTAWESLAPQLRAEGLITEGVAERRAFRGWLRAAAAVVLVAGGAVLGRLSAGVPMAISATASSDGGGIFRPASNGSATAEPTFASQADAIQALTQSSATYQAAVAYLAAHGPDGAAPSAERVQRRIAALDDIAGAVRAALWQAPDDPVVNQAYLQTLGARETALRALGTAMPQGKRLTSW